MSCSKIDRGSQADCLDLPEGGTRPRLILVNHKHILNIYETSDGVITGIELIPGTSAYEFLCFSDDVKKSDDAIKGQKKRFAHNVGFVIYETDQQQKINIRSICKGRFLVIVENKGQDENSIEVLGKNCGLSVIPGVIRDAHIAGGFFTINLATPGGAELERKLPQALGLSYQDGLDIIDGLLIDVDEVLITADSTQHTVDTTTLYTVDSTMTEA